MIKINIVIGVFSVISAVLNLWIGLSYEHAHYTQTNAILACIQIFFAVFLIVTAFSRLKWFYSYELLSRLHFFAAILFYVFLFAIIFFYRV